MSENLLLGCTIIITILLNIPLFLDVVNSKNDKTDKEEFVKKIITTFGALFLSVVFSILVLMPLSFASEINNNIALSVYPVIILAYLSAKLIVYFINYFKVVKSKYDAIYVRDIFVDYSPAVLSLLLNHKTEDKKDFDSTVLNIHSKEAIKFNEIDNKLDIVDLHNQKAVDSLTKDEKYIYNVLTQNEKFDKQVWHNIIQKELDKRNFVKKTNKSIIGMLIKTFLVMFFSVFLLLMLFIFSVLFIPGDFFKGIVSNYFNYESILSVIWVLVLIPFQLGILKFLMFINKRKYLKDKMDYYTEKGALEMLKWKKFNNFIEDFSMLNTADVKSVVLWEKYIAYAMTLNINKSYNSNELKKINEVIGGINWVI